MASGWKKHLSAISKIFTERKSVLLTAAFTSLILVGVGGWFFFSGSKASKDFIRKEGQPASKQEIKSQANLPQPKIGQRAPDITFKTVEGKKLKLSDFRGQPVMLWFVATWCSTCKAGIEAIASRIDELESYGLRIVTLKVYKNLGYEGPSITDLGKEAAGPAFNSPNWLWGVSTKRASFIYDPKGYPDIYWLIDGDGVIRAVNGAPNATMDQIMDFLQSS